MTAISFIRRAHPARRIKKDRQFDGIYFQIELREKYFTCIQRIAGHWPRSKLITIIYSKLPKISDSIEFRSIK